LWLSVSGLPKKVYSWEDTFDAANSRIAQEWVRAADPDGKLSEEERDRIRSECPLWATPHMCRHSFALKWFCILSLVEERRLEGFSAEEIDDFRDQLGDIWLQMSILLGHKHPDTTREPRHRRRPPRLTSCASVRQPVQLVRQGFGDGTDAAV
jgi:integrase